jgi:hypothetical protein
MTELIRGNFTLPKAVREVPQWALADMGFVDHTGGVIAQGRFSEEGCV